MASEFPTADEVLSDIDLHGKRYLITGVTAGLGTETARALVARGASVVGTARDLEKARTAVEPVVSAAATSRGSLELVELDLGSLANVRACAAKLLDDGRPFDAIIANAGVLALPQRTTADGFETHFGVNHLGHFELINALLPLLRPGSRVVMLSASGHSMSDIDLGDLNYRQAPYSDIIAYCRSKTANILFAVEFDRRHRADGVRATALHPGVIQTELARNLSPEIGTELMKIVAAQFGTGASLPWRAKTLQEGAATTVWAAVVADPDAIGAQYCEDCSVAQPTDDRRASGGVRSYALDPARAKILWERSEALIAEAG